MKKRELLLSLIFLLFLFLYAYSFYTKKLRLDKLEKLKQQSLLNLKKYSLVELTNIDAIKNKWILKYISNRLKENPANFLFLNHLKSLSAQQTKALAQWKGDYLYLNGLTQIDEITVRTLLPVWNQYNSLSLNGLTQIDESTAKALALFQDSIWAQKKIGDKINSYKK